MAVKTGVQPRATAKACWMTSCGCFKALGWTVEVITEGLPLLSDQFNRGLSAALTNERWGRSRWSRSSS